MYGVHISTEAITRALSKNVKPLQLDLNEEKLPFDDESFDLVVVLELIYHLLDPDAAIEEMKRVLSPDGMLLLSTPNLANWMN